MVKHSWLEDFSKEVPPSPDQRNQEPAPQQVNTPPGRSAVCWGCILMMVAYTLFGLAIWYIRSR
jgi:hypothetical protein